MTARHRAFTLVEILACILLFAVGTMSVIGVFLFGVRTAASAQAEASAWATAMTVLKDPLPLGVTSDPLTGQSTPWTWSRTGATWNASDGTATPVWSYTGWDVTSAAPVVVYDMADPKANNAGLFTAGTPAPGCASGWLNGYYVERREQSLASDRLNDTTRLVEVRVDVYWASYGPAESKPLASVVDRVLRSGGL